MASHCVLLVCLSVGVSAEPGAKPNVILMMADDLGWGDTGYNGHEVLRTPHLDQMADEGICFDRFYSGAPVCSPTRGSCLTGRHPYRYGVFFANTGHMRPRELTLAEVHKVEQSLVRSLTSVFHGRIKYPEPEEDAHRGRGSEWSPKLQTDNAGSD